MSHASRQRGCSVPPTAAHRWIPATSTFRHHLRQTRPADSRIVMLHHHQHTTAAHRRIPARATALIVHAHGAPQHSRTTPANKPSLHIHARKHLVCSQYSCPHSPSPTTTADSGATAAHLSTKPRHGHSLWCAFLMFAPPSYNKEANTYR
jgi:hypothetical protein